MKKLLVIFMTLVLSLGLAACGDEKKDTNNTATTTPKQDKSKDASAGTTTTPAAQENAGGSGIDLSKYPEDLNEWTMQNLIDYFEQAVEFPSDCESWISGQDELTGTPVSAMAGIWNADGTDDVELMFIVLDPENPDTTPEVVEEIKQAIRDDKNHDYTTDDLYLGIQDHLVGNVAFSYGAYTTNEEVYNAIEEAYGNLISGLGAKADF